MAYTYNIKDFSPINDLLLNIHQQFKQLLLTDKFEKINDVDYGCGLYRNIFEYDSPGLRNDIKENISLQVKKYMPYIVLEDFIFEKKNDVLFLTIKYDVAGTTQEIRTKLNLVQI